MSCLRLVKAVAVVSKSKKPAFAGFFIYRMQRQWPVQQQC